jgi:hypothetical protein
MFDKQLMRSSRSSNESGAFIMHSFESPLAPFESPKELLDGAKERLTELEATCKAIAETRDYEIIAHTDPKTREKVSQTQAQIPAQNPTACVQYPERHANGPRPGFLRWCDCTRAEGRKGNLFPLCEGYGKPQKGCPQKMPRR